MTGSLVFSPRSMLIEQPPGLNNPAASSQAGSTVWREDDHTAFVTASYPTSDKYTPLSATGVGAGLTQQ